MLSEVYLHVIKLDEYTKDSQLLKVTFSSNIAYLQHEILNVSVHNKSPSVQNLEKRIAVSVENRSLGGQNVKKLISVPGLLFDTLEYVTWNVAFSVVNCNLADLKKC